ncbi:uncharacterized protein LOC106136572 [Amyelois transitella]|uniref:uncharacterized protein LOC106136572 n=1 Tax=Amyelois transitella TaxID=680683 RepID=UPI002990817D|nr:uncharacterized protein LOC106136572 [Amyelois transitella]
MLIWPIFLLFVTSTSCSSTGLQLLFPAHRQYIFLIKTTVSTGLEASETYWSLDGKLSVLVENNFTRARFQLEDLEASAYSGGNNYYNKSLEAEKYLTEPWEVDFYESGSIDSIYLGSEPVWSKNVKRALALNFQVTKKPGTYKISEPCLYNLCHVVYTTNGNSLKKYTNQRVVSIGTEYYWTTIPTALDYIGRGYPESMALSERVYDIDEVKGLLSLELKGTFQYRTYDNLLSTVTSLSLYYESHRPMPDVHELDLNRTSIMYETSDSSNPSNGIREYSQEYLKNKTYRILLKIATEGIDAENIVRNATLIHNVDFAILLNTMSQLDYEHLVLLFENLILGTSYDIETSRNIFLEMVPHVKTHACARFIKYLVIEKKDKIEDAAIIALIRKIPFNIAKFNQSLLEELEVFTKLGLDFSPEIRRAGILSFATLVQKTQYTHNQASCCTNYLDYIVVKYFRMYSDCPQYIDRLIWLQGLCNIGYAAQAYTNVIYGDTTKNLYERLWAAFSSRPEGFYEIPFEVLKINLPILTNQTEHVQLRIVAIQNILASSTITESDFLFVHNYIKNSTDSQLKSFWYSSILSIRDSKSFGGYRTASSYIPFIINDIPAPSSVYWATNNKIVTDGDASLQLISIGDETMMPWFVSLKVSTGGLRPYQAAVYLVGRGVSADLYKEFKDIDTEAMKIDELISVLQKMSAWGRKQVDDVHIDVIVKVLDMTVYATHLNQTRKYFVDAMYSALEFLRLGSHINQQLIQVPSQMEVHLPSVLGVPIRLHTTSMSFASIRGNLSASENLLIRNDLHLRYQGIALTSLSTDGILLQTEHVARIQSSVVAHLPMKFNVSLGLENTQDMVSSFHSKKGGIAMHTRKEIALITEDAQHVKTVGGEKKWGGATGYFSDCIHNSSVVSLLDKIFGIKVKGDVSFLDPLHKLWYFLKNMLLSNVLTTESCGLLLPIENDDVEKVITLRLKASRHDYDEFDLELVPEIWYYSADTPAESYLKSVTTIHLKITKTLFNVSIFVDNDGYDVNDFEYPKDLKLNFSHIVDYHPMIDQDISSVSLKYNGTTSMVYYSKSEPYKQTKRFDVKFQFAQAKVSRNWEKSLSLDFVKDDKMPKLVNNIAEFLSSLIPDALLDKFMEIERLYAYGPLRSITVKQTDSGYTTISANDKNVSEFSTFESNTFQYLDSLSTVQRLKKIGLYKECRVQESTVNTLHGTVERVEKQECPQSVVLADCTAVPKFAITRLKDGGYRFYHGGVYVDLTEEHNKNSDGPTYHNNTGYFDIQKQGDLTAVSSAWNVQVYYTRYELIILMPSVFMSDVCGECMSDTARVEC